MGKMWSAGIIAAGLLLAAGRGGSKGQAPMLIFPSGQLLAPWAGEGFAVTGRPRVGARQPFHAESGEVGTGRLRSPAFRVVGNLLVLRVNGWDGSTSGDVGRNEIHLVRAADGEVLRAASPPNCDPMRDVVWVVGDLAGQEMAVELVDGCRAGGYAWLGIESVRQDSLGGGPYYRVVGEHGGEGLGRGTAVSTSLGLPLAASTSFPLARGQVLAGPLRARTLYLLGRCPLVPLGRRLGELEIRYQDGTRHHLPLVCGATTWPGEVDASVLAGLSPLRAGAPVRQAMARSVHVRGAGMPGHALLAVRPADKVIAEIRLQGQGAAPCQAQVTGLTVETQEARQPRELARWLAGHLVRLPLREQDWGADLAQVEAALQPPGPPDLAGPIATAIPPGFTGPRVEFRGNVYADLLTNIFHATVADMASKVDGDGTFHTSSRGAASWGGPWLWQPGQQTYYQDAWSRDLGRVMMELVDLGYREQAERCLDFTDRCLFLPGRPAGPGPRSWPMVMNNPSSANPESDGHGLTMLFHYRAWLHGGRRPEWVREHWRAIQEAAEYLAWCLEHPEQSRSQHGLVFSATEAVGVYMQGGFGIYCDVPCLWGLRGYAQMAAAVGQRDLAARWRAAANRLERAVGAYYPGQDAQFGATWDRERSQATPLFWGTGNAAFAPLIVGADYLGLEAADRLPRGWRERTANTYRRQLAECRPAYACFNGGLGYTHCFLTQAAQLLDLMGDAAQMLRWLALVSYDPRAVPYVVPEVGWAAEDGQSWRRLGDQGNAVQEGEAVKCLRLVLGVDDLAPERTTLMPRLPEGWSLARASGYPVVSAAGGRTVVRKLNLRVSRPTSGQVRLEASFDGPVAALRVRLGPFPAGCRAVRIIRNGRPAAAELCVRGDSTWAWVEAGREVRRVEVSGAAQ